MERVVKFTLTFPAREICLEKIIKLLRRGTLTRPVSTLFLDHPSWTFFRPSVILTCLW